MVFMALSTVVVLKYVFTPVWVGIDASLYAEAAAAWLAGSDPWAVSQAGIYFAAPPPTLLPFALFAWMPPLAVALIWIIGSFGLGLAGDPGAAPADLVDRLPADRGRSAGRQPRRRRPRPARLRRGTARAASAPFLKIYAFVPMVGERRWREVAIVGGAARGEPA